MSKISVPSLISSLALMFISPSFVSILPFTNTVPSLVISISSKLLIRLPFILTPDAINVILFVNAIPPLFILIVFAFSLVSSTVEASKFTMFISFLLKK